MTLLPKLEHARGLWISEDGTRAMRIRVDGELGRVSVWRRQDGVVHLLERPAKWHPPDPSKAKSENARARMGYLQAEVGEPGLGSTYDLMVGTRAADSPFVWGPAPLGTPRSEVRLFPNEGASFYEAVLGAYDYFVEDIRAANSWMLPLSTWLPASEDDAALEPLPAELRSTP